MFFNSLPFLIFFIIFFSVYLFTPIQLRLWVIIFGSTVFYAYWNPYYIFLPHALTLLAYLGSLWICNGGNKKRKYRLPIVIFLLLLPLILIKYADFLYNEVCCLFLDIKHYEFNITLPLSISFVTFTLISYVVDIAHGRYPLERRFSMLTGLVLFFPHLIAGPILRPHEFLPQLEARKLPRHHLSKYVVAGIIIFSLGILKKVVFADQLSACVDPIYSTTGSFTSFQYLLAIYGFAVQLYCDFSGYTDMAIGLALMLGLKLPSNFNSPYAASSLIEFWRRWHITLSTWLRDYLYIPLGGKRVPYYRQIANILITMGLGGLWHGASWTFLLWGLIQGLGLVFVHAIRRLGIYKFISKLPIWMFVLISFHFTVFGWVFFRAKDISTAWRVITGPFVQNTPFLADTIYSHAFFLGLLVFFFATHRFDNHKKLRQLILRIPRFGLWIIIVSIWLISIIINTESSNKFIYFDF